MLGQRDWIRWIEDAKKPETRARRVTRTVSQLEDGKRRACCVDVNSFMMCRIKEDDDERRAKRVDNSCSGSQTEIHIACNSRET